MVPTTGEVGFPSAATGKAKGGGDIETGERHVSSGSATKIRGFVSLSTISM
jgi:hypothetical protein